MSGFRFQTYDQWKTASPYDDEDDDENYESPIKVMLTCTKDWYNESDVEFINIEEDMQGRDLLTFKCPECGETHTSYRCG